jgi:hypothetical protein
MAWDGSGVVCERQSRCLVGECTKYMKVSGDEAGWKKEGKLKH